MSKYTTQVRFICEQLAGLYENADYSDTLSVISKARENIFDFTYPIFDVNYKPVLETKILQYCYFKEIGFETMALWKFNLNTRLNIIMPYYNKLYLSELIKFNPMYTHELTREHDLTSNVKSNSDATTENTRTTVTESKTDDTNKATDRYSDTPQGGLDGIESNTYLTDARIVDSDRNISEKDNENTNEDSKLISNAKSDTTENYLESIKGYSGTSASSLLVEYRKTFINIDSMILHELDDLFMLLW